jgi:ABC-type dipeptide/oligopeptide/nickel transport system ATPase component
MDIPSLTALPSGCTFHPRCGAFEEGLCDVTVPQLTLVGPSQTAACLVAAREHGVPTPGVQSHERGA